MIFSFSRMRKIPQRMKNVSCLTKASFRSSRLPLLKCNWPMRKPAAIMLFPVISSQSFAYLTPFVTSANCKRSYFLKSWCVGMWPWKKNSNRLVKLDLTWFCLWFWWQCFWPAASSQAAGRWESSSCSSDWSDDSDGKSTKGSPPLHGQKRSHPVCSTYLPLALWLNMAGCLSKFMMYSLLCLVTLNYFNCCFATFSWLLYIFNIKI